MKRNLKCFPAKILLFGFTLLAALAGPAVRADCTPPPAGLVGWWKGEGNANDSIGTNNGSLSASGATYADGEVGLGFRLDGTNGFVQIPDSAALKPTNVTLEAWVWLDPKVNHGPSGECIIFTQNTWSYLFEGYSLLKESIANGDGTYTDRFQFVLTSGGDQVVINSLTVAQRGVWFHVAATYDGNQSTLYVNGVAEASAVAGFALNYGTLPVFIGTTGTPAPYTARFAGIIDEVSIYNRALGSNEIAAIYHAGSAGKCLPAPAVSGVPAIFNFSPAAGSNGTVVVVSGTNFSANAAANLVHIGAVQATVLSASVNRLTVSVPPGATFGPITVTVGGLTASSGQLFLPTFAGNGSNIDNTSFAPSFNLPTGGNPQSCLLADLDGDGKPDIALVSSTGQCVAIFRNISTNGAVLSAASFAPAVNLPFPTNGTGGNAYRVRAVDLDGDGKLDLIACEVNGNRVSVFHNLSRPGSLKTNSFEPAFALIAGNDCRFATAADLDGDGRVDIVALNYGDKTISIFQNIGAAGSLAPGSFAPPVTLADPGGPYDAVIADLDGDGKPDLAVANTDSGTVSIFQNAATPGVIATNSFLPSFELPAGTEAETIAAVDLDGDGKLDLVVGSVQDDVVGVLRNTSSGGRLTTNAFAPRVTFGTPGWVHVVAVADFNGDGKPDVAVVGELPSYLSIFQNTSTPGSFTSASFAPRVDFGTGWNAWGVAAGDLDGDGRPDMVFCNQYDATLQIYQNVMPFGTPPPPPPVCTPAPSGLVGWWKGEGNANDSIGTNNGALSPSGATYARGEVGEGFRLDGTNGYVQIPDSAALQPTNVTVEAWVWLDPNFTTPGLEFIIFKQNSWSYLFEGYSLLKQSLQNADGSYTDWFEFVVSNDGNQIKLYSTSVAQRGVWTHVAGTYDGNQLTIYVNGVAQGTAIAGFPLDYGPEPVFLGTSGTPAPYTGYLAGIIDEASIYNRALAGNEIAAIYNAGSAGKCLVLAPPVIVTQPVSQTNLVGATVVFSATASGTQPLTYQWSFAGTNIVGATNSSLTLVNVQASQAGNYAVLVANLYGSAISSNASLTVWVTAISPAIVSQTPNQIVLLGNPATFSVTASGTAPLSYFWSRNGALIPNATNSSYTLLNAQLSDSGSQFSCLVTNACGSAASSTMTLKVIDSTIANDLCSGAILLTNASCTNFQSTVQATSFGDPAPDCVAGFGHGVWYQFTAPAAGRLVVDTFGSDFDTGLAVYTGSCDALTEVACNDDFGGITSQVTLPTMAGTTYLILAGGYQSDAGNLVLHLNHLTPPVFTIQPANLFVVVSSNAIFSPELSGTLPMSFQWYFNNVALTDGGQISGSTKSTLAIANVQANAGGNYYLVASNLVGVTTSSVAVLAPVILPPVFLQPPLGGGVVIGSNVNISVIVGGTPPFSYLWSFNGQLLADDGLHIAGSTTASLTISNFTTADAGDYSLTVTNSGGAASGTATLWALMPPAFVSQPVGRSVPPGLPTTFTAQASGNPAPVYQWLLNGTNLFTGWSATPSYTVPAVGTNNLGFYSVVASNWIGSVTSAVAQLTFGPVAAWGRNISGECLPPPGLSNVVGLAGGYPTSFAIRADGSLAFWGSGVGTNVPASATNVVAVAAPGVTGDYALRADGTVVGWFGCAPPPMSNIVAIAAGNNFALALRAEGSVVGWGNTPYSTVPAGLNHVTAISCGNAHSLALRRDGTVAAWGAGVATNIPAGLADVTAIAAGFTHSLALKSNGTVVAWGSGTGTNLPAGLTNLTAVSTVNIQSSSLSLALRANGTVVAWGDNPYGETNPPAALTHLLSVALAAAPYHGLALVNDGSPQILHPPVGFTAYTSRDVTLQASAVGAAPLSYQWLLNGTNVSGATNTSLFIPNIQMVNAGSYQLFVSNSINTAISLPAPVRVISNSTLTFLSQTSASATNVYQGGKVSFYGGPVLGDGPLSYQWYFSPTNRNYTAVPGATNDTLALDPARALQSGSYYLAVSNGFIQPPYPTYAITSAPVSVRVMFAKAWGAYATDAPFILTNATAIAVGNYGQASTSGDYFALSAAGKISSWSGGLVSYGETNFAALSNSIVTAIAAGYADTLALKSDGTLFAAGYNPYGETNIPSTAVGITAIACGDYHDLALRDDGTVIGWGQNTYLQTTNAAATNVVAIAAGNQHSLALRADGSVVGWGFNGGGQTTIPFSATNLIAIAAGNSFSVALRANGTVVQWGNGITSYPIPNGLSNVVAISASGNHCTALRNDGTVSTWGIDYLTYTWNAIPSDLTNVIAIASGGDHDLALFGTRAPAFTVQPWSRSLVATSSVIPVTTITLAGKCAGVQPISYQWRLNGTNYPGATNDTLTLRYAVPSFELPPEGAYQLVASNAYGVAVSQPAKVAWNYSLGYALNATSLPWTTTGVAPWYGQTNYTHDGVAAASSGGIGPLQETILQTTLATNLAGTVSFWWKVSSEPYFDTLEFRINGTVQGVISGEMDWQQASFALPAGTNVLMWRYSKDPTIDLGLDAGFVDQFAFAPSGPLITLQPASQVVNMGANVTFTVAAVGGRLTYQWWHNGMPLANYPVPTLAWNNVGRVQDGNYYAMITDSLTGLSTVSSNATLKVLVPQHLGTPVLLPDGSLRLTSGDANGGTLSPSDLANFEAQASTNLVNWVTLPHALSLTNGMLLLEDYDSNYTTRYYRILEH